MSQSKKYREVYELYQFCSNGKDLKEFCIEAGVNYNKLVCQNIGSETAAENASFMFSLMESCKLNKLKEEPYMETLFNSLGMEQVDWKQNLPCYYKQ